MFGEYIPAKGTVLHIVPQKVTAGVCMQGSLRWANEVVFLLLVWATAPCGLALEAQK